MWATSRGHHANTKILKNKNYNKKTVINTKTTNKLILTGNKSQPKRVYF